MHFGFNLYASNALGYIAGIIFSFVANSVFTFSVSLSGSRFAKFLITCFICWVVNILTVKVFITIFPGEIYSSQIAGMILYTLSGFVINKLWVMK
ncbi:GtrA family protein [Pantoea anthophila]|uniref:GtrA family protein n=1 Tax=Pantoea anthophila TaxID=470931 RepID=UPI002DB7B7E6|nr:GtrA family protein [Pantoea anthophila]MEB6223705.1 GtrA family protein [Pantoea anthophila]